MKNKIIISILLFSIMVSNVSADDSIYIISGDQVLKQGSYKFVALENISSDILIDTNQIYFYTQNFVYSLNSSNGSLIYKLGIKNALGQKLTDSYLYIQTLSDIITINKYTGERIQKDKYHQTLDDIFSLPLTGSTTINNYYVCTTCVNGTDGLNGTNGSSGTNGIDGLNGTNAIQTASGMVFFLHNTTSTISGHKEMDRQIRTIVPISYATISNVVNGNTSIVNFSSNALNTTFIPSGVSVAHLEAYKTSTGGTHVGKLFYELWLTNSTGGNATKLLTSSYSSEVLTTPLFHDNVEGLTSDRQINITDRLLLRIYLSQTGVGALPSYTLFFDDATDSRLILPANTLTSGEIIAIIQPSLDLKVNTTGDTMTGNLNMSNNNIIIPTLQYYPYPYTNNTLVNTTVLNTGYTLTTGGMNTVILFSKMPAISYNGTVSILQFPAVSACGVCGIRLALYNGNSTDVITLLNESSNQAVVAGINNLTIPTTAVNTSGTYWLGIQTNSSTTTGYYKADSAAKRLAYAYNTFPNPANSIANTLSIDLRMILYSTTVSSKSYACFNETGILYPSLTSCV